MNLVANDQPLPIYSLEPDETIGGNQFKMYQYESAVNQILNHEDSTYYRSQQKHWL